MAVEIEVDPFLRGSALGAAEELAIKAACRAEIVDRKGEMERRQAHGAHLNQTGLRSNQGTERVVLLSKDR